jgi:DNA-binding MarR family transcriptional regulator
MNLLKSSCICNQCIRNYNSILKKVQVQLLRERIGRVTAQLGTPQLDAWRALLRGQALVLEQVERDLAEANLPPLGWYDVLTELNKAPGGRLRIHELADAVVLSRSGLSRLIDRIEEAGLVARRPCPGDRRAIHVELTEKGEKMLDEMWCVYARGITEHFLPAVGEEACTMRQVMESVADSVRRPTGDGAGPSGGDGASASDAD